MCLLQSFPPPWAQVHSTNISLLCEKHSHFSWYSGRYCWTIYALLFRVELQSAAARLLIASGCESTYHWCLVSVSQFYNVCTRMRDWYIKGSNFHSDWVFSPAYVTVYIMVLFLCFLGFFPGHSDQDSNFLPCHHKGTQVSFTHTCWALSFSFSSKTARLEYQPWFFVNERSNFCLTVVNVNRA